MAKRNSLDTSKGLSRAEPTNKTRPFEINRKLIFLLITVFSPFVALGDSRVNAEPSQKEKPKEEKALKKAPEQPKPGMEIKDDSPDDDPIDPLKRLYEDAIKKKKKKKKRKKKKKITRVA